MRERKKTFKSEASEEQDKLYKRTMKASRVTKASTKGVDKKSTASAEVVGARRSSMARRSRGFSELSVSRSLTPSTTPGLTSNAPSRTYEDHTEEPPSPDRTISDAGRTPERNAADTPSPNRPISNVGSPPRHERQSAPPPESPKIRQSKLPRPRSNRPNYKLRAPEDPGASQSNFHQSNPIQSNYNSNPPTNPENPEPQSAQSIISPDNDSSAPSAPDSPRSFRSKWPRPTSVPADYDPNVAYAWDYPSYAFEAMAADSP